MNKSIQDQLNAILKGSEYAGMSMSDPIDSDLNKNSYYEPPITSDSIQSEIKDYFKPKTNTAFIKNAKQEAPKTEFKKK